MLDWLKGTIVAVVNWIKGVVTGFVNWCLDAIKAIIKWFADLAVDVFKAAWDFVKDFLCWCIDELLGLVVKAVNAVDFSGLQGFVSGSDLPSEILNVLSLCGVGTAVGIITTAIAVRLVLQLIPFTRLGS
ncbi:MAG: DUF2523 domain-containing protein [Acidovorax sp.]|nr:DUF2523 domain-containing protein [Acidovorax sp.]